MKLKTRDRDNAIHDLMRIKVTMMQIGRDDLIKSIETALRALNAVECEIEMKWKANKRYGMYPDECFWICPQCKRQSMTREKYCPECGMAMYYDICDVCEHTLDECDKCYSELGYKNTKLERDTETVTLTADELAQTFADADATDKAREQMRNDIKADIDEMMHNHPDCRTCKYYKTFVEECHECAAGCKNNYAAKET